MLFKNVWVLMLQQLDADMVQKSDIAIKVVASFLSSYSLEALDDVVDTDLVSLTENRSSKNPSLISRETRVNFSDAISQ